MHEKFEVRGKESRGNEWSVPRAMKHASELSVTTWDTKPPEFPSFLRGTMSQRKAEG